MLLLWCQRVPWLTKGLGTRGQVPRPAPEAGRFCIPILSSIASISDCVEKHQGGLIDELPPSRRATWWDEGTCPSVPYYPNKNNHLNTPDKAFMCLFFSSYTRTTL